MSFRKILVANRGEIAVRVIRACRDMGIGSVAVYSEADRRALHVLEADEAYPIGPAPSAESYLRIDRVLEASRRSGAEAIHPGYGFLSENPAFAAACREAGIVFIGPPPEAMEAVGDKVRARDHMARAGIPVVPGTPPLTDDAEAAARAAERLGYPVLLKASAGGGGKGMRLVRDARELRSLLAQARGEALSAFGDDRVFLEKYVVRPRHIEVQVIADGLGGCVALGERECSIQRRHQKLVEECPSPVVDPPARERLMGLAVSAMRAVGYVNAGTVEFLRADDGTFYFMEVNARLQVEHPVTEEVFGLDLVRLQIEIAAGGRLPFTQEELTPRGHAIECRIVAEDPARGFLPSPGTIRRLRVPTGPGIRHDGGTYDGWTVPVHYDPMLAKIVAWGATRQVAVERMARALHEYRVEGPATCIEFHRRVMAHPAFRRGDLHTGFLEEYPELLAPENDPAFEQLAAIAAAVAHLERRRIPVPVPSEQGAKGPSAWRRTARWGGLV
ncbi:MAG TPA: acetyl-CoA carboxylase biotin carboxylase subunit [Candidatus Polarisedimenticolaceae bacterium]|nr:acetyl-CoA carboxylase biotin carboxylase subunit [Candidatus Polarisedimenticolaceae bacterium]